MWPISQQDLHWCCEWFVFAGSITSRTEYTNVKLLWSSLLCCPLLPLSHSWSSPSSPSLAHLLLPCLCVCVRAGGIVCSSASNSMDKAVYRSLDAFPVTTALRNMSPRSPATVFESSGRGLLSQFHDCGPRLVEVLCW